MVFNEGGWDRTIRILAGLVLAYIAWTSWPGAFALVAAVLGAVLFATGIVGVCPAYLPFHISTKRHAHG